MKQKREAAGRELATARKVIGTLNAAKDIADTYGSSPATAFTTEEKRDLAFASGVRTPAGITPAEATEADITAAIVRHEVEDVVALSTSYIVSRSRSPIETIRHLRAAKAGGTQTAGATWRILALSLPDYYYGTHDLEDVHRTANPNDPTLVTLRSGVIWHALYGAKGGLFYDGEYEHLVQQSTQKARLVVDADGILVDPGEPFHAVIVSVFRSRIHDSSSPARGQIPADVIPLSLRPSRYLFIRRQGQPLADDIVAELDRVFGFRSIVR